MPRTEHLNNLTPNRVYALDAQVIYKHSTGRNTTAIVKQDNSQAKIRIPSSQGNSGERIEQGCNYHFGFCYIGNNGWISVRNPDNTIESIEQDARHNSPMSLSEIANHSMSMAGQYLTTLLYVISVNPTQTIVKNGKNLTLCILNCYSNGYLVDVTLWNFDLPIHELSGNWIVFSGFRLKKLVDWKFVLVSSVYSKIAPYAGNEQGMPFIPSQKYLNLSCVFDPKTIPQLTKQSLEVDKCFSEIQGTIKECQVFAYEGCSECKKKVIDMEHPCQCSMNSRIESFTIIKIRVTDEHENELFASIFEPTVQEMVSKLTGPTLARLSIKSLRKTFDGEVVSSHLVSKVLF